MQNELYQIVTPAHAQNSAREPFTERMTFASDQARDLWARDQRAKGWEVFFSYLSTSADGRRDLYDIVRRVL